MTDPSASRPTSLAAEFGPLVLGTALGIALLVLAGSRNQPDADTFALGTVTQLSYAEKGGVKVHCGDLWTEPPETQADLCIDGALARESELQALWLGNSQIHSINQLKEPEDQTAPSILFDSLAVRGVDLIALSQPNANLQEHYLLFEYTRQRLPLDLLILPVVFDDTREDGIRSRLQPAFQEPGVHDALAGTEIGAQLVERFGTTQPPTPNDPEGATDADLAALNETVQESTESWLNDQLAERSDLWAARPDLRGQLFVWLYQARNSAFGINPSTVRPLLPGPYRNNLSALDAILRSASESRTRVLVYIPPLRSDTSPPYHPGEYAQFKEDVAARAAAHGAMFVDAGGLVPGPLWGMKESTNLSGEPEFDFMHFQGAGHVLLAEALLATLDAQEQTGRVDR